MLASVPDIDHHDPWRWIRLVKNTDSSILPYGPARMLAFVFAGYANIETGGDIYPSIDALARDMGGVCRSTVFRALATLKRTGVIVQCASSDGRLRKSICYRFDEAALNGRVSLLTPINHQQVSTVTPVKVSTETLDGVSSDTRNYHVPTNEDPPRTVEQPCIKTTQNVVLSDRAKKPRVRDQQESVKRIANIRSTAERFGWENRFSVQAIGAAILGLFSLKT